MTVIAISYTWNQTWIDGKCVEAHPDPAMYYLGIVRKVLRFMLKTKEYGGKRAYLFWVSVVCLSRPAYHHADGRASRAGLDVAFSSLHRRFDRRGLHRRKASADGRSLHGHDGSVVRQRAHDDLDADGRASEIARLLHARVVRGARRCIASESLASPGRELLRVST